MKIQLLWNQGVKQLLANRADTLIKNKTDKICLLIDVAVLLDRNVIQKVAERKLKCKNICRKIHRM